VSGFRKVLEPFIVMRLVAYGPPVRRDNRRGHRTLPTQEDS
jgi:hypothetical protein